jgi:hypothetical protein
MADAVPPAGYHAAIPARPVVQVSAAAHDSNVIDGGMLRTEEGQHGLADNVGAIASPSVL